MSMENDVKILSIIDKFADDVRKFNNGISTSIIKPSYFGEKSGLEFDEVYFETVLEIKRYFVQSRNNTKIDDLTKIKQVIIDLIYEFENDILITNNNNNLLNSVDDFFPSIYKLSNIIDDEIEIRKGKKNQMLVSNNCIDVNSHFSFALFLKILDNSISIKNLSRAKQSIILSKLTGHKKRTFENTSSEYNSKENETYIEQSDKLINDILDL